MALLLLALGLAQDPLERKVEELIRGLQEREIELRQAATQSLVALGPEALPLLEKRLRGLEGEARQRAESVIRRLKEAEQLAEVFPYLKRITLDFEDRPLAEALAEIERQSGIPVDRNAVSTDGKITLHLREATPLQAMEELCRSSGALDFTTPKTLRGYGRYRDLSRQQVFRLQGTPWKPHPSSCVRHYRLQVDSVQETRRTEGNEAWLRFRFDWNPGVIPWKVNESRVVQLDDNLGESLLPDSPGTDDLTRGAFSFKSPNRNARSIAVLKVTAKLTFAAETTLRFVRPAESRGEEQEINGMKIALEKYEASDLSHSVRLRLTGRYSCPGTLEETLSQPFSRDEIHLVTESGRPMNLRTTGGEAWIDRSYVTATYGADQPEAVKELDIRCVTRCASDEVVFEFRDIPLP